MEIEYQARDFDIKGNGKLVVKIFKSIGTATPLCKEKWGIVI